LFRYYKRFDIPDLKRLNIALEESRLKVSYENSTLVISVCCLNKFYMNLSVYLCVNII